VRRKQRFIKGLQGLLELRDLSHKPEEILFGNTFIAKTSFEKTTLKSGMSVDVM